MKYSNRGTIWSFVANDVISSWRDRAPLGGSAENDSAKVRKEKRRLRMNWAFLIIVVVVDGLSYSSMTTVFHQFVVNPRIESIGNQTQITPGLGQSEKFYSWAVGAFNIGALMGAISTTILRKLFVPSWYLLIQIELFCVLGSLIRAITYIPELIILSSILLGYFSGAHYALTYAYIAQTAIDYEEVLRIEIGDVANGRGASIRNVLFTMVFLFINLGRIAGNIALICFTLVHINIFDAISWFTAASGMCTIVLQIFMFHEKMTIPCSALKKCCNGERKTTSYFKSITENKVGILIVLFLLFCRAVGGIPFSMYEIFFSPVLSDYFGISEHISPYFFTGLAVIPIFGSILLLFLQYCKLDSRIIVILTTITAIIAAALMGDWQAIPYDPCTEKSPFHHPEHYNTTSVTLIPPYLVSYEVFYNEALHAKMKREIMILTPQQTLRAIEDCENTTFKGHQCHWAPKSSVIPSYYCKDCQPICRSPLRSLSIIQFCLGFFLINVVYPINLTALSALLSDNTSKSALGLVMGGAVVANSIGKIITPTMADAMYEVVKKRTYLFMSVVIGINFVALMLLLISYRLLRSSEVRKNEMEYTEEDYDNISKEKLLPNYF